MDDKKYLTKLQLVGDNDVAAMQTGGGIWQVLKIRWNTLELLASSHHYDIFALPMHVIEDMRRLLLWISAENEVRKENIEVNRPMAVAMLETVLKWDIDQILIKDREYGGSWKTRGGQGAFMMLARKWDRIEQQVIRNNHDFYEALRKDQRSEGLLDDIGDLRRYLLLVSAEMKVRSEVLANAAADADIPF